MTPEEREFGARMLSAVAKPARLHILEYLAKGSASVGRIAQELGLKQSMTSQHLAALYRAGVVVRQVHGNARIYSLRGARIAAILKLVEEFYAVHLDSLRKLFN